MTLFTFSKPCEPTSNNHSREVINVALNSSVLKRFKYNPKVMSLISLDLLRQLSERIIAANLYQKGG